MFGMEGHCWFMYAAGIWAACFPSRNNHCLYSRSVPGRDTLCQYTLLPFPASPLKCV